MNRLKKIVAGLMVFGMMAAVAPSSVQAVTADELQVQITALLAQLATLQAQLATLQGVPAGVPAACSGITFTANLTVGSSGSAVKCLQALLNQSADTQVAATGVGSAGNETTYFGPLTQAAVVKYQNKYASEILTPLGLTAGTGFVGSATRTKLNALLTVTPPVACTTDANCAAGQVCTAGACVTPSVTGTEGTLSLTAAATPADAQNIYVGQVDKAVSGLSTKALGSDIKLSRLDINFTTRPWLNISTITISDGTTDVVYNVTQADTLEVTAGSSYTVRITNLNMTVPNGTTKTLTIKVTPKLVPGDSSETITYQILANSLRGRDGVNIEQYAPTSALTARTFTIATASGALALSVNTGNPAERAVIGSASAITEVELLRFDLKATVNDVIVSQVVARLTDEATAARQTLQTLTLYDGGTALAATSTQTGAASTTFAALTLRVPKDTTKTLSIKGTANIVTGARENSSSTVSLNPGNVTVQDSGTFASVTTSGSTITAKTAHLYTAAPSLALVSTSIATNRAGRPTNSNTISVDTKIKFNVTANGKDIYVSSSSAGVALGVTVTNSITVSTTTTAGTNAETDSNWVVREGDTKWFEVSALITNSSPTASYVYANISRFTWGTSTAGNTYTWDWTSLPLDFKTGQELLQAIN